jgi:hypothetical protein
VPPAPPTLVPAELCDDVPVVPWNAVSSLEHDAPQVAAAPATVKTKPNCKRIETLRSM